MGCSIVGCCDGESFDGKRPTFHGVKNDDVNCGETFNDKRPTFHDAKSDGVSSKLTASRDIQKFIGSTEEGKTAQDRHGVVDGEEGEIKIEKNNHSVRRFVLDDEDKFSSSSSKDDTIPQHLEFSVKLPTISGHVQSPVIDSTKTVIEIADFSARISISDFIMTSIDPDDEPGELDEAKLKIKENEKKIQELLAKNEKLKTIGRNLSRRQSIRKRPSYSKVRSASLHKKPSGRKKLQRRISLQAQMEEIKNNLLAGSTPSRSRSITESPRLSKTDSACLDSVSEPQLKFALSADLSKIKCDKTIETTTVQEDDCNLEVDESKVKSDTTVKTPTVQENDSNWDISELILL